MPKTKSRRLPFVIAIILAVLSIAVVAVATLAGWIEADAVKGEFHFGTIAAIKEYIGSFVPDPGLVGGTGKIWWAANQSPAGMIAVVFTISMVVVSVVLAVISGKKKSGRVADSIVLIPVSVYLAYLFSFLFNGYVRETMERNASFWLLIASALAVISFLVLVVEILASFSKKKEMKEAVEEVPAIDEEAARAVIAEQIQKHEDMTRELATEEDVSAKADEAVKEHAETVHAKEKAETVEETPEEETPAEESKEEPEEEPEEESKEEPAPETPEEPVAEDEETPAKETKVLGKYEVFPEAGFFKYRLKANNGQILLVSNSYTTQAGALKGIETLRKNVEVGTHRVITDKKGRGQFRIFTANDSRLVVAGEIYPDAAGAQKALDSVLRFYATDKVVKLDEIPEAEIREWKVELAEAKESANGKLEITLDEDGKFVGRLLASNGELLFLTPSYSNKSGLMAGVAKIKEKALGGNVSVVCDKQGSYQFKVYADNGMVLVMGETYPSKDSAISAACSARNFLLGEPKVVDATKPEAAAE
ncbi:MAG: DUF1508 domain-containing protein [Candidatus Enteromonas sp.]|nr:DUF1508 domain-containing protein [Candidatus Enteromonas sp.]